MSILTKGMEMPKNCHLCPMCLMRFCQAGDRELSERETRPNAKRPEDCPLLPIPPHGKLIEKNTVFELIRSFPNVDRQLPVEFMKALYELPTVIEAEEGET